MKETFVREAVRAVFTCRVLEAAGENDLGAIQNSKLRNISGENFLKHDAACGKDNGGWFRSIKDQKYPELNAKGRQAVRIKGTREPGTVGQQTK